MTREFRKFNLKHEDSLEVLRAVIEENTGLYEGVRIRLVAARDAAGWSNVLTMIQAKPRGSVLSRKKDLRYQKFILLEQWISINELMDLAMGIKSGSVVIAGETVALGSGELSEYEFLSGRNDYSQFPGHVFPSSHRKSANFGNEALVGYKMPMFPYPSQAIGDWSEIRSLSDGSDARIGNVILFLPECRARISNLKYDGKMLRGRIARAGKRPIRLEVKGAWRADGLWKSQSAAVRDGGFSFRVPSTVDDAAVYLVGADGTIFDRFQELRSPIIRRFGRRAVRGQSSSDLAIARTAIQSGEGETTEFKPYLKRGDPKLEEFIETVIAFLNSRGGNILIGVNNRCGVDGIATGFQQDFHCAASRHAISKEYVGFLRQHIAGILNRSAPIEFGILNLEACSIILVRVPHGTRTPYSDVRSNAIYIRSGASNRMPREHELRALLGRHDSDGIARKLGLIGGVLSD